MFTRGVALLTCLALTGCAKSPQQFSPEFLESYRAAMANSRDDAFAPLRFGEVVPAGQVAAMYHFVAKPGDVVTVTARSRGGQTGLNLAHTVNMLAEDGDKPAIRMDFEKPEFMFDVNGPHAEVVATLPEDVDGIYLIQVTNPENVASLTLSAGAVPSDDIVQLVRPRPDSRGKFVFPVKADGTLAGWVARSADAAQGRSLGDGIGRAVAHAAGQSGDLAGLVGIAGQAVGQAIAIDAIGGWEFIRQSSDQSFDSARDMARFFHYRYAKHPRYASMVGAAVSLYPGFEVEMDLAAQGR